jgi:hypothetical protein
MTDAEPIEIVNLDRSGTHPVLPWSRAYAQLSQPDPIVSRPMFLTTVTREGRPHSTGVAAIFLDGGLCFISGPRARKTRNLLADPHCTLSMRLDDVDLVLTGTATRVTDEKELRRATDRYREQGWPAEPAGPDVTAPYGAPSAGPPPWHLFRFTFATAVAVGIGDPNGATLYRFPREDSA